MKAVICPVCGGSGKLPPVDDGGTGAVVAIVCHGCCGLGWVTVPEEKAVIRHE